MKTVVYIISTLKRSGPTNVLAGIVKNLDRNKYEPIIITLSPEPDDKKSWWEELQTQGVSVYSLNLSRLQGLFLAKSKLKRLLTKIQPDIIHCHCFRSTVLIALYFRKYASITTIHCDYKVDYKMTYGGLLGFFMSAIYTWALRRMKVRVACSQMLADILNRKNPTMHFEYVNNGVDTDKFHPIKDKIALRQQLGLPTDKKIIIWAGHLIDRKDPLTMAKTILQVPEDPYYFIFCGEGSLLINCKEILKNRTDVLFTGHVTNVEQYFQAADIYVSTAKSEGLPLAVLEAEFCGLVPLLSGIAQHCYIVPEEVSDECIYEKTSDLILKLNNLLKNDPQPIMQKIQGNLSKFSATQMSDTYQGLYGKCK